MSIKRVNGYMTPRQRTRKEKKLICRKCQKELTPQTAFFYVDSCNYSITENSPPYCRDCYREVYGQ